MCTRSLARHHEETLKVHLENYIALTKTDTFVLTWDTLLLVSDMTANFTGAIKIKNPITTSMADSYPHYVNMAIPGTTAFSKGDLYQQHIVITSWQGKS